ncbi:hypothetical protein CALCODRAFT_541851, partial [Calocera cornea HHB12733]
MPPLLERALQKFEDMWDTWWRRIISKEDARMEISKLSSSPLIGRSGGKHYLSGVRHRQSSKCTVDILRFAYDHLPLPKHGCSAQLKVPADYFDHPNAASRLRNRTKMFITHMNDFYSRFESFYDRLKAMDVPVLESDAVDEPSFLNLLKMALQVYNDADTANITANIMVFASVLRGLEHITVTENGIPKFCERIESGKKRKRNSGRNKPIILPESPSQVLRPFELSGLYSPLILCMPQNLVANDLSLHLATEAHIKHGHQWPLCVQDPECYVAARMQQLLIRACVDAAFGNGAVPTGMKALRDGLVKSLSPAMNLRSYLYQDRTRVPRLHGMQG